MWPARSFRGSYLRIDRHGRPLLRFVVKPVGVRAAGGMENVKKAADIGQFQSRAPHCLCAWSIAEGLVP